MSSQNLAIIPAAWTTANTGMDWGIGSTVAVGMDTYPVTVGGRTAVQMRGNKAYKDSGVGGPAICEIDSYGFGCKVGSHITYKGWLWTDPSSLGDSSQYDGAVFGLDLYDANRICEISTPNGRPSMEVDGTWFADPASHFLDVVPWGTPQWVQCIIDFLIGYRGPNNAFTSVNSQGQYWAEVGGGWHTPVAFIPWVTADSMDRTTSPPPETGKIYFSNAEVYINGAAPTTHTVTLQNPTGVSGLKYIQPQGTAPFQLQVNDQGQVTVQVPGSL